MECAESGGYGGREEDGGIARGRSLAEPASTRVRRSFVVCASYHTSVLGRAVGLTLAPQARILKAAREHLYDTAVSGNDHAVECALVRAAPAVGAREAARRAVAPAAIALAVGGPTLGDVFALEDAPLASDIFGGRTGEGSRGSRRGVGRSTISRQRRVRKGARHFTHASSRSKPACVGRTRKKPLFAGLRQGCGSGASIRACSSLAHRGHQLGT